jgi:hypothetical protein
VEDELINTLQTIFSGGHASRHMDRKALPIDAYEVSSRAWNDEVGLCLTAMCPKYW